MFGSVDSNWEWREYGRFGRLEADIPQLGKLYGGVQQSPNPTWAQVSTAPIGGLLSIAHIILSNSCP
jgi:hypothetical protein